ATEIRRTGRGAWVHPTWGGCLELSFAQSRSAKCCLDSQASNRSVCPSSRFGSDPGKPKPCNRCWRRSIRRRSPFATTRACVRTRFGSVPRGGVYAKERLGFTVRRIKASESRGGEQTSSGRRHQLRLR